MKRNKKLNKAVPGQLCLFETPPLRGEEKENRTKAQRKPVEASKPAAPIFIPPAPVEALKQPENTLKTKIPDREELRRLWKANPEALHTLNQMAKKNPAVRTPVRRLALVFPLPAVSVFPAKRRHAVPWW